MARCPSSVRPSTIHNSSLFILEYGVDFIQACTRRSPDIGVYNCIWVCSRWRHLSYFRFHGRFNFLSDTFRQTLFRPNHLQDLTKIHIQCSYGGIIQGVLQVAPPITVICIWLQGWQMHFTENVISPRILSGFYSNLYTMFTK